MLIDKAQVHKCRYYSFCDIRIFSATLAIYGVMYVCCKAFTDDPLNAHGPDLKFGLAVDCIFYEVSEKYSKNSVNDKLEVRIIPPVITCFWF